MDRRTILHGAGAVLGVSAHSSGPSMKAVLSSLVHAFFVLVSLRPVGMRSNPVRVHGAASQDGHLCLGQVSRCTALWSCFTTCLSVSHLVDDDRCPVRRIGAADGRRIDLTPIHHGLCRHAMTGASKSLRRFFPIFGAWSCLELLSSHGNHGYVGV